MPHFPDSHLHLYPISMFPHSLHSILLLFLLIFSHSLVLHLSQFSPPHISVLPSSFINCNSLPFFYSLINTSPYSWEAPFIITCLSYLLIICCRLQPFLSPSILVAISRSFTFHILSSTPFYPILHSSSLFLRYPSHMLTLWFTFLFPSL